MGLIREVFQESIADETGIYDVVARSGQASVSEPNDNAKSVIHKAFRKAFNPLQPRDNRGRWVDVETLESAAKFTIGGNPQGVRMMTGVLSTIDDSRESAKAQEFFRSKGVSQKDIDEAVKAASEGRAPVSVQEYNQLANKLESATGKSILDLADEHPELGNDRSQDMALMQKLIDEHGDKPHAWEPNDYFDIKNFEPNPEAAPEVEAERKAFWESRQKLKVKIIGDLRKANLSPVKKREFAEAMYSVFQNMSPMAMQRAAENIIETKFYSDKRTMTRTVYPDAPSGKIIGGCWVGYQGVSSGVLHLNGGGEEARTYYAHELGHSVDWSYSEGAPISESYDWQVAFESEVNKEDSPLSIYAKKDKAEGFAEFARLAWSGRRPREIAEEFPKCWQVFLNHQLVRPIRSVARPTQATNT